LFPASFFVPKTLEQDGKKTDFSSFQTISFMNNVVSFKKDVTSFRNNVASFINNFRFFPINQKRRKVSYRAKLKQPSPKATIPPPLLRAVLLFG
jgi:hypothetical protein